MRALRIIAIVLAILLVGTLAAASYLLAREEVPAESTYRIDVPRLRELATSLPGEMPIRLNHELIAIVNAPRGGIFAGESFDPHPMLHGAYQIIYADGFALVDAAMNRATFTEDMARSEDDLYNELGWMALDAALERARAIVITHEHADHLSGITAHPRRREIATRVHLNPEQLGAPSIDSVLRDKFVTLQYDEAMAFLPGVVLLRAAGHTPGSQMVFVKLRDGREFLLLGDVAWHMDQIRNLHYRPRLVTDLMLGEDRAAVLSQFRALHDLLREHPDVQLIASHDADQRLALVASGRLGERFE